MSLKHLRIARYKLSNLFNRLSYKLLNLSEQQHITKYFDRSIKQIYHFHIRKTAGTSINHAIISSITNEPSDNVFKALRSNPYHRIIVNNLVIAGWSRLAINNHPFHYAFSHIPFSDVKLNESTITFTCLRDPFDRIFSHYRMLKGLIDAKTPGPHQVQETQWAQGSFLEFVEKAPRKHLENQLYMFSKTFNVSEAISNIKKCDIVLYMDKLDEGLKQLSHLLGIEIKAVHKNKSPNKITVNEETQIIVKEQLKSEYIFFNTVKALLDS